MRCIKCRKETSSAELFCRHCGTRLDLNYDQVTKQLEKEIIEERKEETEAFFRWLMFILIFAWLAGVFFNQIWNHPPSPSVSTAYIPNVEIPSQTTEIQKPLVIPNE